MYPVTTTTPGGSGQQADRAAQAFALISESVKTVVHEHTVKRQVARDQLRMQQEAEERIADVQRVQQALSHHPR